MRVQFPLQLRRPPSRRLADGLARQASRSRLLFQRRLSPPTSSPVNCLVRVDDDTPGGGPAALPCGTMTGAGSVVDASTSVPRTTWSCWASGRRAGRRHGRAWSRGRVPHGRRCVNPQRLELALELGATHPFNAGRTTWWPASRDREPRHPVAIDPSAEPSFRHVRAPSAYRRSIFGVVAAPEAEPCGAAPPCDALPKGLRIQFIMAGSSVPRVFLPKLGRVVQAGRPSGSAHEDLRLRRHQRGRAGRPPGRAVKPVLLMSPGR